MPKNEAYGSGYSGNSGKAGNPDLDSFSGSGSSKSRKLGMLASLLVVEARLPLDFGGSIKPSTCISSSIALIRTLTPA
jgi:hypothetical protein